MNPRNRRIIYESESKQTKVYLSENRLVKTIDRNSSHYQTFLKELKYYKVLSGNVAPRLLESNETSFTTQYLAGGVLLDYINKIDHSEYANVVMNVLTAVENFNSVSLENERSQNIGIIRFTRAFVGKAFILLLSGPKNTVAPLREVKANKILSVFLKPLYFLLGSFSFVILKLFKSNLLGRRFHGDLHLNNIVLDEDKNIFLVDFENVEEFGGKIIDVLFFFTILTVKLPTNVRQNLLKRISNELCFTIVDTCVWNVCSYMMRVNILRNSKFK